MFSAESEQKFVAIYTMCILMKLCSVHLYSCSKIYWHDLNVEFIPFQEHQLQDLLF